MTSNDHTVQAGRLLYDGTSDQINQIKHEVTLESIGPVTVSTVELPIHWGGGFETCLFWADDSMVVEKYNDIPDAANGHRKWINPEVIAQAIAESGIR